MSRKLQHPVNAYDKSLLAVFHAKKKIYKYKIKRAKFAYDQSLMNNLTSLQSQNPKAFWELFKKMKDLDKTHKENPIRATDWVQHFQTLLNKAPKIDPTFAEHVDQFLSSKSEYVFNELNFSISESELHRAIKSLKKGKASGVDGITNEMIIASAPFTIPYILHLFNKCLTTGTFPTAWGTNTLTPLHKKGSVNLCENYRGIAVSSCFAKLFLTVLHNRLSNFVDNNNLIPPNQIGYKKGSRTSDHILTLKNIIDNYISKIPRQYLYACFVDFKSAFDTVWRNGLFYKLLQMGIGGNFLRVLQHMYRNVFYTVKLDGKISTSFKSTVGVKQGCVLSPLLFNLYVSDLPAIFDESCDPVSVNDLRTSSLLFADDLVLLSETAKGLQQCLNKLNEYCKKWGLTINVDKTKILIFNKGGLKISKFKFYCNRDPVQIVQHYCYLGIIFSSCGSFTRAIKALQDKARKAFFALKEINTSDSALVTLKLFDSLVMPIITYVVEVWGPFQMKNKHFSGNLSLKSMLESPLTEALNIKLCKYILGVGRKAPNDAVRGELGRLPTLVTSVKRCVTFAKRSYSLSTDNLLKQALPPLQDIVSQPTDGNWTAHLWNLIHFYNKTYDLHSGISTLFSAGFPPDLLNLLSLKYQQYWSLSVNKHQQSVCGNKLKTYSSFKKNFDMENYVLSLNLAERRHFSKLRTSCHHLAVETLRYTRPITPREKRFCTDCNNKTVGDEQHFLLHCPKYDTERSKLFMELAEFSSISNNKDFATFYKLMTYNSGDTEFAKVVSKYTKTCFTLV
jgi:hypothetical protein